MNAQVIPVPTEGHGRYTWSGYHTVKNRYAIRRARNIVANVILNDDLPFHSAILTDFCRILDNTERGDCELIPITRLGEPDTFICNTHGDDCHDPGPNAA